MKRYFLLAVFFLAPALCLAAEDLFEIKPVADGVYAAIAKPTYRVNANFPYNDGAPAWVATIKRI